MFRGGGLLGESVAEQFRRRYARRISLNSMYRPTPQRYLNRLRLIKARHLLRHSDHSSDRNRVPLRFWRQ